MSDRDALRRYDETEMNPSAFPSTAANLTAAPRDVPLAAASRAHGRKQGRPTWLRYGVAVLSSVLATVIAALLDPYLPGHPRYLWFLCALLFTVWYAGIGPAVLNLVVGPVLAAFFILHPRWSIVVDSTSDQFGLLLYCVTAGVVLLCLSSMTFKDIQRRREVEREMAEIAILERQRIGQDLHDGCGQELTALGLLLESLTRSLEPQSAEEAKIAERMRQGLRRVLRQIRNISRGLSMDELDEAALPDALLELVSRLSETSGVECVLHADKCARLNNKLAATHLYHIAQEASTNALKHAQATTIEISLRCTEDSVSLVIRDDGIGVQGEMQEGLGQRIMRNRAAVIGAKLTVESATDQGTVITCVLPQETAYAH